MREEQNAEDMAAEFMRSIQRDFSDYGYSDAREGAGKLLAMVRAVVREELAKADERAQASQQQATQAHEGCTCSWCSGFEARAKGAQAAQPPRVACHDHHSVVTQDHRGHTVVRNGQLASHCSICGSDTTLSPVQPEEAKCAPSRCESVGQLGYRCTLNDGHEGLLHRSTWNSWS